MRTSRLSSTASRRWSTSLAPDPGTDDLQQAAADFADELTRTVQWANPKCVPFRAMGVEGRDRVVVAQSPDTGIDLLVGGEKLILLKVRFDCAFDHEGRFLAVERSHFHISAAVSKKHPLFRFEYERSANRTPSADFHIRAHRDSMTYLMVKSGSASRTGRKRTEPGYLPTIQDLHFPLGGHRFRPCLEDVLTMLADEFGLDRHPDAFARWDEGRARWRKRQLGSAVRDDPQTAVRSLRALGYTVDWTGTAGAEPGTREDRLRSL